MKDVISKEKAREKEGLSKSIAHTTALAEVAQALGLIDLAGKYMWAISNANLEPAKILGLTGIKKYWRRAEQVEIKLDWLYDWILTPAPFLRHLRRVYNNKELTKNIKVRQDIDLE